MTSATSKPEDGHPVMRPAPKVIRWAFDSSVGQINAFDAQGQVLMAIPTNALFGARLAAAFCSPPGLPAPARRPPLAERLIPGDLDAVMASLPSKPWLERPTGPDLLLDQVQAMPARFLPARTLPTGDSHY